jgi:ABC-2 type transport system permease protein
VSSLVRAAWRAFILTTRLRVISPWAYLTWLVLPVIFAIVGLSLFTSTGPARVAYGVLGGGLIGFWSVAYLDGGQSIQDERWSGTLEQIFAVPTPLVVILIGKICSALLIGLLSFVPTVLLAVFVYHAVLPSLDPLPFAVSFVVLTFGFFAIAVTLAPLFTLWRWAFSMLNGFELGVYALSGFMYPVSGLPAWLQPFAYLLAPTWATKALYAAATSQPRPEYGLWLGVSLGLVVIYLAIGVVLYRVVEVRARVSGDLALA